MSKFDSFKSMVEVKKAEFQAHHEAMRIKRSELLKAMALEADIALDGRRSRKQKQEA